MDVYFIKVYIAQVRFSLLYEFFFCIFNKTLTLHGYLVPFGMMTCMKSPRILIPIDFRTSIFFNRREIAIQ